MLRQMCEAHLDFGVIIAYFFVKINRFANYLPPVPLFAAARAATVAKPGQNMAKIKQNMQKSKRKERFYVLHIL